MGWQEGDDTTHVLEFPQIGRMQASESHIAEKILSLSCPKPSVAMSTQEAATGSAIARRWPQCGAEPYCVTYCEAELANASTRSGWKCEHAATFTHGTGVGEAREPARTSGIDEPPPFFYSSSLGRARGEVRLAGVPLP